MEPRSEDGHLENVAVQQLPQAEHGGNPVRVHAHEHTCCKIMVRGKGSMRDKKKVPATLSHAPGWFADLVLLR